VTVSIIRNFVPKASSGGQSLAVDARQACELVLARWLSGNRRLEFFTSTDALGDIGALRHLPVARQAVMQFSRPMIASVEMKYLQEMETRDSADKTWPSFMPIAAMVQALRASPILFERHPISWFIRHQQAAVRSIVEELAEFAIFEGDDGAEIGVLDDTMSGPRLSVGAGAIHAWTARTVRPIVSVGGDAEDVVDHDSGWAFLRSLRDTVGEPAYRMSAAMGNDNSTLFGLAHRMTGVALLEAISPLVRRRILAEPADLGLKESIEAKDPILRTMAERAKTALLMMGFSLVPHLVAVRLFERFTKHPVVAEALDVTKDTPQTKAWLKAVAELIKLPVPPIFSEALRVLNPKTGVEGPWSANPLFPYHVALHPKLNDATVIETAARSGGLLDIERTLLDLRQALTKPLSARDFGDTPPSKQNRAVNGDVPSMIAQLREHTIALHEQWFKDSGGEGQTTNQPLRHFRTLAEVCGWRTWSDEPVFSNGFMWQPPTVVAGAVSDQPVADSLDLAYRDVIPFSLSYGRISLYTKGSLSEGVLVAKGTPTEQTPLFVAAVIDLKNAHKTPSIWTLNDEDRELATIGELLDPLDYEPLIEGADEGLLENLGPDGELVPNTLEHWAMAAGLTVETMKASIIAHHARWRRLMSDEGEPLPGIRFAFTSRSLRAMAQNLRVEIPRLWHGPLVLLRDGRIFDAYSGDDDGVVVGPGKPAMVHSLLGSADKDLANLGFTTTDWVRAEIS
jgi:hypothetical protein